MKSRFMKHYVHGRMRALARSICIFVLPLFMSAQAYAQNAADYGFTALSGSFIDNTGGSAMAILGDDVMSSVSYNIGFNFVYCGTTYTQFRTNSNGWMTFGTGTTNASAMRNNNTTNLALFTPALMPLWDDCNGAGATATYVTTGTVGNRVLTVEWKNWRWYWTAGSPTISFQVKLYETTNIIEFVYRQEPTAASGVTATIGIANTNTDYLVLNNSSSTPTASSTTFTTGINSKPATGQIYRFSPPLPCTGTPTAGTIVSSGGNNFCGSATTTLSLSGQEVGTGISYQWQSSPNGTTWTNVGTLNSTTYAVPGVTSSTLYRAQVTCTNSSSTVIAGPILINVAPNPVVGVTPATAAICSGDNTTLTAAGASSYTWSPGTGLSSTTGTSVTASPTASTTYTVTGTLGSCTGTATADVSVGTPFTLTDLTATPAEVCSGGSTQLTVSAPVPGGGSYCIPTYSTGTNSGDYIANVEIATTTLSNATGGTGTPAYEIYPPSGSTTATLTAGSTYTINITVGTVGGQRVAAWIDYNSNGILDDAGELLAPVSGSINGNSTASFTFTVPPNTLNGLHRLRTRCVWGSSGASQTPCSSATWGQVEDYDITIEGGDDYIAAPPYVVNWSESLGGTTLVSSTANPVTADNITVDKVYSVSVTKDGCTATGDITVVANPLPTATMTVTTPTVCAGDQPTIEFTGTPNAEVVYDIDGSNPQTITLDGSGNFTETAPVVSANTTYSLVSATNLTTSCSATFTTTASVTVNPRPTGLFIGSTTVCRDQPATISYGTGSTNFPIDVTFSDGTNTYTATATGSSENFPVPTDVPGTYNYVITALTDVNGCDGQAGVDFTGSAEVIVKALPTATVTSTAPGVCAGGNTDVTITFTGDAPFIFDYYDGTGTVSPAPELTNTFTFNVTPAAATTYYVESLLSGSCLAETAGLQDSATVVIWDDVAITAQPMSASACSENSVTISMTAEGEALSYVWYENGTPVSGPNYNPVDNMLTINNVSGLGGNEYHVVVSGTCGADQTSDTATLTENFGNDWSGTTSTDWSDASNWSCGTVPIITTNVMIPVSAPNMPLVDITTALCNDLTLSGPGATLGFDGTGNQLSIYGDLTNSGGTFNGSNGTVEMAGTTQSVNGALTFDNLEVNGGGTKMLNGEVTVQGILNLIDGNLELGTSNLILEMPTAQLGGSATSFIVTNDTGVVIAQDMGAVGGNPDAVTFHVGANDTSYTPMMLENLGDADEFSVRVMENVYVDGVGTDPEEVTNPVVDRTWMVSEGTDGGSIVNMTPYWNSVDEINGFNPAHVYVTHFMGGEWTAEVDSASNAPAAVAFGAMWSTMEDSITSFSPFAVASSGQFPLGIRLSSITAMNAGPRNKVTWTSAAEEAGDSYELESSADAKTFTKIATVKANGQPSTYTQWDENPVDGVNYYRVKLVNASGKYSYSKVVSATVNKVNSFTIEAYPNPVRSTVSVKVNGVVTGKGSVVVTDVAGKVVSQKAVVENNGAELNVSHLANGIYMLNYSDDARNESIKINKQ